MVTAVAWSPDGAHLASGSLAEGEGDEDQRLKDLAAMLHPYTREGAYGKYFDGELEHWHYDTFRAIWKERMLGKTFVTFALDADGRVKSADVEGMTTFNRRPDAADTVTRVVLAASDAAKLTGAFTSQTPALTVEVSYTDGALRLTVPGQPVYTLLADSPTRFRLTGPPNMPAGFFLEYRMEGGAVKELVLIQPTPRPTLTFSPRK